jgi:porphobilinogen synthase
LTPANFIYPIFVHDGEEDIPIDSMPGQSRLGWKTGMIDKVRPNPKP